jgi:hypothetical protein
LGSVKIKKSGSGLDATNINRTNTRLKKDGCFYGRLIDLKIIEFRPIQEITPAEDMGRLQMIHTGCSGYFFR